MASPLRPNQTLYGTSVGTAIGEGDAEAARRQAAAESRAKIDQIKAQNKAAGPSPLRAAQQAAIQTPGSAGAERVVSAVESAVPESTPRFKDASALRSGLQSRTTPALPTGGPVSRAASGVGGLVKQGLRTTGRAIGTVAAPLTGAMQFADDTAEQRQRAGGQTAGIGQVGAYLASGLTLGGLSPQDFGAMIERGGNSGQAYARNRDEQGWATRGLRDAFGTNTAAFGVTSPAPQPAAPTAATTSSVAGGGSTGTSADNDRRIAEIAAQNGGITPAPLRSGNPDEVIGTFNGRSITRGQSDLMAAGASVAPAAAEASPLRRPDLNTLGSGFSQASSRGSEINKHFDNLAKQIQDLHGGAKFEARGSLATKLLELEKARAVALGQNAGQLIDSQGNQVSDLGNRRSAEANLYGTDVGERSALRRSDAVESAARVRASADALKVRQQQSEAALKQITDEAGRLFPDDPKGQQAYIDSQNRRLAGLTSGDFNVGQVAEVTAADRPFVSVRDKANTLGAESDRDFTPTDAAPSRIMFGEAVEGTFGEGAGGLGKYLRDQTIGRLPFTDTGEVLRGEDGRMVEWEELTPDERAAMVERQRSKLRGGK